MTRKRFPGFVAVAILAAGATAAACFGDAFGLVRSPAEAADTLGSIPAGATTQPVAVLKRAGPWLTPPPTLRGKVVLVNFWTYSCINSLRALPYLRAWNARYGSRGLTIVGVHAPEFEFEKDPVKVRAAIGQFGLSYPELRDNDYAIWRAFANQGWPGIYFIDAKGRMRGYRLGEGKYAEGEQLIRALLAEAGHDLSAVPAAPIHGRGIEAAADWADLGSPEAYLGYDKATDFAGLGGFRRDAIHDYAAARTLARNQWDLTGGWRVHGEYAQLARGAGSLRFRFHARDAHLVLGGALDGDAVRFRVTIDGRAPGASHGVDVDANGWGAVRQDRLYQLVRQSGEIGDRTVTIAFEKPGVRAYVFTFG